MVSVNLQSALDVPDISPQLLWTDPPFGTGKVQEQRGNSYKDASDIGFVHNALVKWTEVMLPNGVICVCLDYRNAYKVVSTMEDVAGWVFRGEIIWHFGLGRPRTSWWPVRHNTVLTFTRTETSGLFQADKMPTEDRLAPKPGYTSPKKVGSVWYYTMSNTDPERVGYPNQKPLKIVTPFILCHSLENDLVVDPFMGSGTTGVAAVSTGRQFWGCDTNPEAVQIALKRIQLEAQK